MLREAVASVLAQTWRPIEIIIVDDGSTDDTPAVAAELAAKHPEIVRVLRQDNAGPGVARQLGLEDSRGGFVQFLDSDDLLLPYKFALQVAGLRADADAGISYGKAYANRHGQRQAQPAQRTGERFRRLFPALLQGPLWPTMTPLYRRTVLDAIGPWPGKRQLEDWEYDAQAAAAGVRLHYVDDFIAETRDHAEGRLCHLWMRDSSAMRERAAAYIAVLNHAKRAGVPRDSVEMRQFVRSLFWMARSAGSYGLPDEARRLFDLARAEALQPGWDYRLFAWMAALFGWTRASRWADRLARRAA